MTESASPPAKVPWWLKALRMLVFGAGLFPAMFMICTLLANQFVFCEVCCHFWVQYLILIGTAVAILLLLRAPRPAAVLAPFLVAAIVQVIPMYFPNGSPPASAEPLTVMAYNVNTVNTHYDEVANYVLSVNPDLVSFEEVSDKWLSHLDASLAKNYPHKVSVGQDDNFGIALYSKFPITKSSVGPVLPPQKFLPPFSTAIAQVDIHGKPVTVVVVHPPPPVSGLGLMLRTQCMEKYEEALKTWSAGSGRFMLIGDLNCSPWSPFFGNFLAKTGLHDTERGFGPQMSWPDLWPAIRAPIDHILVSDAFHATAREIGPNNGSDHFAIYAKLAIVK